VSPLWRDEVGVWLAPHRVCLVRLKRGLKPVLAAQHEHLLYESGEDGWQAAVTLLEALLGEDAWGHARIRVVVSDRWVRYAVVPWSEALSSGAERLHYARQLLEGTYGDAVSDWEVRIGDELPYLTRVACAMPPTLLAAIRNACARSGIQLSSVQPQLVAAYNSWCHRLPPSGAWFVTVDHGSLAAARLGREGWDRVHSVRIGAEWTRELRRLQTFGRLASSSAGEGQVYVDAPHAWRAVARAAAGDLNWLEEDGVVPQTTLACLGRARRLAA
jgi:hypothetical protein